MTSQTDRAAAFEEAARVIERRLALLPELSRQAAYAVLMAMPDAIRALATAPESQETDHG